jgi:hypothetical protein
MPKRVHLRPRYENSQALPRWVYVIGILLTIFIVVWQVGFWRQNSQAKNINFIVAGDPVHILSLDTEKSILKSITVPASTVINGTNEYGKYSLSALWKLGQLDKKGGIVLQKSLGGAFALPLQYYFGTSGDGLPNIANYADLKKVFSYRQIPSYIRGVYKTNMPLAVYVKVISSLSRISEGDIVAFSVKNLHTTDSVTLPDGSTSNEFNPSIWDTKIGTSFEDPEVRKEALRVSVINTTETVGLGQQASRVLGHMGIFVVSVTNAKPLVHACIVRGTKDALATKTALLITRIWSCTQAEQGIDGVSDIAVWLGDSYE